MTEITFRFVIELSEDTMQFLWELVDELKELNNDNDETESDTGGDGDHPVRPDVHSSSD